MTNLFKAGPAGAFGGVRQEIKPQNSKLIAVALGSAELERSHFVAKITLDYGSGNKLSVGSPASTIEDELLALGNDEYLRTISGSWGPGGIVRLELKTNKGAFLTFPRRAESGRQFYFTYEAPEGYEIGGIITDADSIIRTFGVYYVQHK